MDGEYIAFANIVGTYESFDGHTLQSSPHDEAHNRAGGEPVDPGDVVSQDLQLGDGGVGQRRTPIPMDNVDNSLPTRSNYETPVSHNPDYEPAQRDYAQIEDHDAAQDLHPVGDAGTNGATVYSELTPSSSTSTTA